MGERGDEGWDLPGGDGISIPSLVAVRLSSAAVGGYASVSVSVAA